MFTCRYADIQAKADREEAEALKQKMANKGVLETLQQQMAALEAKKLEEKRLVAEEAELMVRIMCPAPMTLFANQILKSILVCFYFCV